MKKVFISLCCLCLLSLANEVQTLSLSSGFGQPESDLIHNIMQEVSKRSGVKILYEALPNKRSLLTANSGVNDGETTRILEINKYYPNLVPVPVQSYSIDLMAVTNKNIKIESPSDLSQYNVGVINGMKIAVLMAEKANPHSLIKVTDHETLIRMLLIDRLDVMITNKMGLLANIDKVKGTKLYLHTKPLMSRPLYMQLHKKNARYIPKFKDALESMHKDGSWKKIQDDFFKPYDAKLKSSFILIDSKN